MLTEIELKYLVFNANIDNEGERVVNDITSLLNSQLNEQVKKQENGQPNFVFEQSEKQLRNCYFDTETLDLRKLDMGFRIRIKEGVGSDKSIEQTIKTAGKEIGGLHQRPEYNISLTENVPQLALFPEDIWPNEKCCQQIQQQLVPLFNTDFTRTVWLITFDDSVVELVFDQGTIYCPKNETTEAIYELELELVSGDKQALISLAKLLMTSVKMRPGRLSKAARGYALWHGKEHGKISRENKPEIEIGLELIPITQESSVSEAFDFGINYVFAKLQKVIDEYVDSPSLITLAKISELLALLRQGFWLFEKDLTPSQLKIRDELTYFIRVIHWVDTARHLQELTTKTGNYRKKIIKSNELIKKLQLEKRRYPDAKQITELLHSERFNLLQLSLLEMLLAVESKNKIEENINRDMSLLDFAKQHLSANLQELTSPISEEMLSKGSLTKDQYLALYRLLIRSLLTGSWFGLFFDQFGNKEARANFRMPWLDIKQGISELQTLHILQQQLLMINTEENKLEQWLDIKVENLLQALEHSRQMALSVKPYWY